MALHAMPRPVVQLKGLQLPSDRSSYPWSKRKVGSIHPKSPEQHPRHRNRQMLVRTLPCRQLLERDSELRLRGVGPRAPCSILKTWSSKTNGKELKQRQGHMASGLPAHFQVVWIQRSAECRSVVLGVRFGPGFRGSGAPRRCCRQRIGPRPCGSAAAGSSCTPPLAPLCSCRARRSSLRLNDEGRERLKEEGKEKKGKEQNEKESLTTSTGQEPPRRFTSV